MKAHISIQCSPYKHGSPGGLAWRPLPRSKSLTLKYLKLNIQKTKILASGPITSWQEMEKKWELADFIFLGSKINADSGCSHKSKRRLLLGRKATTKLDRILKSRDVILLTKVRLVKAVVFPVVIYGCESWTIRKAEHQRIDAFELWCWRRLSPS